VPHPVKESATKESAAKASVAKEAAKKPAATTTPSQDAAPEPPAAGARR
jgi:hypothetical protein